MMMAGLHWGPHWGPAGRHCPGPPRRGHTRLAGRHSSVHHDGGGKHEGGPIPIVLPVSVQQWVLQRYNGTMLPW